MALAPTAYLANKILDHLRGGTAWTQPAGVYIQLHTAAPGAAGTTAVATNNTRKQVTLGTAASGGAISNTADIVWASPLAGTETYSHFSLWDAATSGNCLWTGDLTPDIAVTTAGSFTIPSGDLDLSITIAS